MMISLALSLLVSVARLVVVSKPNQWYCCLFGFVVLLLQSVSLYSLCVLRLESKAARNQLLPIFQNLDMAKKLCLYVGLPLMSIFQCRQLCRVTSFKSD
jgi:hypothetical protein